MPIVLAVGRPGPRSTRLEARLSKEGYLTMALRNVEEALEALRCVRADLLVVEAEVVHDEAVKLLAALNGNPVYKQLPVLFVGGESIPASKLKLAIELGRVVLRNPSLDEVLGNIHTRLPPSAPPSN